MRIHGSHGRVAIADGSPSVVLASINKWALNRTRDRADVTCFEDLNKVYVQGLPDIKGTLGGFYDAGDGSPLSGGNLALFDAAEGEVPVMLNLFPSSLFLERYWSGLAYLDASIDVAANGAVAISGTYAAAGAWTRH
jgi:hypothetical protein